MTSVVVPEESQPRDLRLVLDEEVNRLPSKYRAPVVLCYFQGKTNEQAAQELGCPKGTILSRLARARERLRARLARRGLVLSGAGPLGLLVPGAEAAPALLVDQTARAALLFAAGKIGPAGGIFAPAAVLAQGVLRTMLFAKVRIVAAVLFALALALAGTGIMTRAALGDNPGAAAAKNPAEAPPVAGEAKPEVGRLAHQEPVVDFALSPDGKMLASVALDATVRLWDVAGNKEVHRWKDEAGTQRVTFSPTGKHLATWAAAAKKITVWETVGGKAVGTLDRPANSGTITAVALAPDGRAAASAHWNIDPSTATICLWETTTGKALHTIPGRAPIAALAYAADGKRLAAGRDDFFEKRNGVFLPVAEKMFLCVYDTADARELYALEPDRAAVKAVAFAPDGSRLASVNRRGIVLWELATGWQVWTAPDPATQQPQLMFAPDGKALACVGGGLKKKLRVLDPATGKETFGWNGTDGWSVTVAFPASGRVLAAGQFLFRNKTVVVWDAHALGTAGNPDPVKLTRKECEAAWDDLKGSNAGNVRRATITLQQDTEQTVTFVRQLLAARPAADSPKAPALIKQLNSDDFQVREQAFESLAALGDAAQSALERALQDKPTLEMRKRIETLLEKLALPLDRDEHIRWVRMFYVLGQIGSPEARQVLETIASRSVTRYAGLAPDAQRALDRLGPKTGE